MNKIFIEAKHERTSEYNFIQTIVFKHFPNKEFKIVCMDGVANLFSETILNQINQALDEGDHVLVLVDADDRNKGWGFSARRQDILAKANHHKVCFPFFVYPNHMEDGDVEVLMESVARKDIYRDWWSCFEDYEVCVKGAKDENGNLKYKLPNRKAKLHTFISSQTLSNKQRDKVGRGYWLFDNPSYWDLESEKLKPLLDFLAANLL